MFSKVGSTPSTERALQLVGVLVEEGEAEDADRGRVGLQLLHDQIVVLAGLDIGAVLTDLGRRPSRRPPSTASSQAAVMTSSTKASRVPEVGGGPSTSIFSAGSDGVDVRPVHVRVRLPARRSRPAGSWRAPGRSARG